jgi:hypothetical protein
VPIHDWTRVKAGIFHYFHQRWIGTLCDALNDEILSPPYYALGEQVTDRPPDDRDIPDVLTLRANGDSNGSAAVGHSDDGGTVALAAPPKTSVVAHTDLELYRRKQSVVTVRHSSGDRVVAVIEIVSPANKSGSQPFGEFVEKAAETIARGVHLLILDVLPPTPRDPNGIHGAIWSAIEDDSYSRPPDKPLTVVAYECADTGVWARAEPVAVGDRWPDMPLFLRPGGCVMVPLEATYNVAWGKVPLRWRRVIDPNS